VTKGGYIITDDIQFKPSKDFERYSEGIARIVRASNPKFSVGIYGEKGSGKTTLMRLIRERLEGENVVTVWFDAWRYERENQLASIALMNTIADAIGDHKAFKNVKKILLRGALIVGKSMIRQVFSRIIGEKGLEELEKRPFPRNEFVDSIRKDTIYFSGIRNIALEMDKIIANYPDSMIIVFINDLDKCSPSKYVEVFNSIRIFLGIRGFVYFIELTRASLGKLALEYSQSDLKGYIRDTIQMDFVIPPWSYHNIKDVLLTVAATLPKEYSDVINKNNELILGVLDPNPKEVIHFINTLIVANEVFSSSDSPLDIKRLLVFNLMVYKKSWSEVYRNLSNARFLKILYRYLVLPSAERTKALSEIRKRNLPFEYEKNLLEIDSDLWEFLSKVKDILFQSMELASIDEEEIDLSSELKKYEEELKKHDEDRRSSSISYDREKKSNDSRPDET
jgi:predicted KAP-like P-loop ATPase